MFEDLKQRIKMRSKSVRKVTF